MAPSADITELLLEWSEGSEQALNELMPLVYEELRKTARAHFSREPTGHTLQTTALINEVYIRLSGWRKVDWQNRTQFFAFASKMMRRILVDYARGRQTAKRGGATVRVGLEYALDLAERQDLDMETLMALDEALTRLEAIDPGQSEIVELRFFGGLTVEEVATAMGISRATVNREWSLAKLWLATLTSLEPVLLYFSLS
ncbi:MAG: sigma-70 family RNA polymerase sigma factor [bacterium]|nr:sigma-70 family RNA polymerase sigma factor [bacterium]